MVRLAVALLVAVVLVSCATSREMHVEGKQVYSIECRAVPLIGSFDCIEKAQNLCGMQGYTELEKKSVGPFKSNMIIQCSR